MDPFNTPGQSTPVSVGRCSTGGACGTPGLCPGTAILLAYLAGAGLVALTGLPWLGWAVGVPLGLALITGAWRWLPRRRDPVVDSVAGAGRSTRRTATRTFDRLG
jgi:hypothetical protein